ncbi:hypothetical protein TPHA_0F03050 [Tetrapisispora phaffii CBS 4417]|uniref:Uncharacterized protein n=1 Tax=Tetrapisispora phaffii (strain ATCC 24235 / CBS 4417 / NBRC 1672 / NRRL Y-8282 / UCD 70-5) TaxID=1071381 RepID=G8BUK0_TETPH|nr:hypothetical protein TPHA_0F03050 [Tetrapisispora phaffii CBS 4417]CCE63786.1 hypothetical protein TPHA_0F03050 [Tetrapisispora phaffii CBS 4417]
MKFSTSALLLTNTVAIASAYENLVAVSNVEGTAAAQTAATQAAAVDGQYSSLVAVSNVEGPLTTVTAAQTSLVAVSNVEGVSSTADASAQEYAVEPSTTVTTTDYLGRTTTEVLWYLPETSVAVASAVSGAETISSAANTDAVVKSVKSAETEKATSSQIAASNNAEALTSSIRNWDEALTTVTATNSDGVVYTSKIWWLPSTSETEATASNDEDAEYTTSYSKYETTYTSTSESELETITTTFSTAIVMRVASTNSTASVHSNATNGAFKNEYGFGAGAGMVALAAFLL